MPTITLLAIKEYQKNLLYPVQVTLKLLLFLFWTASLQSSPLKSILDALKRLCWQHKDKSKEGAEIWKWTDEGIRCFEVGVEM